MIRTRTNLLDGGKRILHVAPEDCIRRLLQPRSAYLGIDLDPDRFPGAVKGDITRLGYREAFDAVVCSHVLEHIPDERQAMSELLRALRPGGIALIQVPTYGETTFVQPGLDKAGRLEQYGCADHVRLNGRDFADRLRDVGFTVEVVSIDDVPGTYLDRTVSTPHTRSDDLLFVAIR